MDLMETHFLLVDREAYISSMVSRCGRRRCGRSVLFLSASRRWPIDRPATRSCTTPSSLSISPSIETFATEIDREKMAALSTRINSCGTCSTRPGGGSKNERMRLLMLEANRTSDSRCKCRTEIDVGHPQSCHPVTQFLFRFVLAVERLAKHFHARH